MEPRVGHRGSRGGGGGGGGAACCCCCRYCGGGLRGGGRAGVALGRRPAEAAVASGRARRSPSHTCRVPVSHAGHSLYLSSACSAGLPSQRPVPPGPLASSAMGPAQGAERPAHQAGLAQPAERPWLHGAARVGLGWQGWGVGQKGHAGTRAPRRCLPAERRFAYAKVSGVVAHRSCTAAYRRVEERHWCDKACAGQVQPCGTFTTSVAYVCSVGTCPRDRGARIAVYRHPMSPSAGKCRGCTPSYSNIPEGTQSCAAPPVHSCAVRCRINHIRCSALAVHHSRRAPAAASSSSFCGCTKVAVAAHAHCLGEAVSDDVKQALVLQPCTRLGTDVVLQEGGEAGVPLSLSALAGHAAQLGNSAGCVQVARDMD